LSVELAMAREANEERRTVSVRIEGRVQGVYYRAWTDETARALGLAGTVRNRDDGSVEAVFSGPVRKVDEMLRLCADGPPDARVSKVTVIREGGTVAPGFRVIGTNWR
jgi:acylphosphatase